MSLFANTGAITGHRSAASSRDPGRARYITILCSGLLGLGALSLGSYHAWMGISSGSWRAARGTVVSSLVEERQSAGKKGRRGRTYEAKVRYEYSVDGRPYQSEQIRYGLYSTGSSNLATGLVQRYPEGTSVQVRYKPGAPGTAVLETGFHPLVWAPVGLGAVFLGLAAYLLFAPKGRPARAGAPPPYPPRQL